MSWEAWGDDDAGSYDHLLEAGWWTDDQVKVVCDCIKALAAEPVYEDGKKENGISVRFLMRLTDLRYNAGLIEKSPLTDEAEAALYPQAASEASPQQEGNDGRS